MSHHSFIEHVKSADFIVQIKEIKVSVFNQTNTKSIIKYALGKKHSQRTVTDEKRSMTITNITILVRNNNQSVIIHPT